MPPARSSTLLALGLVAALLAGCGGSSTGGVGKGSGPLTVYLSVPLSGSRAAEGGEIAAAAKRTLAEAGGRAGEHEVKLVVLDDTGGGSRWSPVATGANARTASENADAIAYIGDLEPGASATSLPISDRAEIPQVLLGAAPPDVDVDNLVQLPRSRQTEPGASAMSLVLAAISRAGSKAGDREAVLDELRSAAATP